MSCETTTKIPVLNFRKKFTFAATGMYIYGSIFTKDVISRQKKKHTNHVGLVNDNRSYTQYIHFNKVYD